MHAIHAADDDSLVINILIRSSTFHSAFFNTLTNKTILGDFFQKTLYRNKEHSYLLFHAGNDDSLFRILEYLYLEECSEKRYKNAVKNQIAELFFSILLRNHEKDVFIPNPNGGFFPLQRTSSDPADPGLYGDELFQKYSADPAEPGGGPVGRDRPAGERDFRTDRVLQCQPFPEAFYRKVFRLSS